MNAVDLLSDQGSRAVNDFARYNGISEQRSHGGSQGKPIWRQNFDKIVWIAVLDAGRDQIEKRPSLEPWCIALLTSSNLDDWTLDAEPLCSPNDMFCPECPELLTLQPAASGIWCIRAFTLPVRALFIASPTAREVPLECRVMGRTAALMAVDGTRPSHAPGLGILIKGLCFGWLGNYVGEQGKWLWGADMGVPRQVSADLKEWLREDMAPQYLHALKEAAEPLQKVSGRGTLLLETIGSTRTSFPKLTAEIEQHALLISFNVQKQGSAFIRLSAAGRREWQGLQTRHRAECAW
ncbi:uncharacterized protein J7T54_007246 [Emericellopsis cladophorae]|uniref:Uncharacterized protein n=1 Tax=Emericellopsis cladophorae TaxID=2686198 RepID=A0A9Q0BCJ4_9HYPO|nr:uncharacterized protein J7T54_007246 [Emericellopsis cladophorae]KAI6780397.1 hypothetical protein J7T54_007246 [Emericellopsis cladophorae]